MKRSDVLKKLDDYLELFTDSYNQIEHSRILADGILRYLDAVGMLPPKTNKQYNVDKNIIATKEVNEWDNE